ncbi:hypothetical protein, partial [Vibrio cholerae]|uniref:hypothetical protein n=1 Tax=Vibrio cholerae TaxID=666 RepID=UPI0020963B9E
LVVLLCDEVRNPHKSTLLKIVYSPLTPRPASVERRVSRRGEEFRAYKARKGSEGNCRAVSA